MTPRGTSAAAKPAAPDCKRSRRFTHTSSMFPERHLGPEPPALRPLVDPVTDADIEQGQARGFVEDDLVVGGAPGFLAGDNVAQVGRHIVGPEPAAGNQSVEGLARRIVAEHLL